MSEAVEEGKPERRPFNYISGVNINTARRIAKYEFGAFLWKVIKNDAERTFDVYLKEGADPDKIVYFRNYWGKAYKIYIMSPMEFDKFFMRDEG